MLFTAGHPLTVVAASRAAHRSDESAPSQTLSARSFHRRSPGHVSEPSVTSSVAGCIVGQNLTAVKAGIGENEVMVQQVVMRLKGDTPTFETQENPEGLPPLSFEDDRQGLRIPRLGTQDILAIAEFASRSGYRIDSFQLADHTLTNVQDPLAAKVSKELKQVLEAGGARAAEDLLLNLWPTLNVTGVSLTTPDMRTARLQRQGILSTSAGWSPIRFLSDAWQAVRFW